MLLFFFLTGALQRIRFAFSSPVSQKKNEQRFLGERGIILVSALKVDFMKNIEHLQKQSKFFSQGPEFFSTTLSITSYEMSGKISGIPNDYVYK